MILTGGSVSYDVGELVAETPEHRVYLCTPEGGGDATHLLQIASTAEGNAALDRAAYLLRMKLLPEAARLEMEYAAVKTHPDKMLNYHLCFPEVVDTFVSEEQEGRRVSIFRFRGVDDVRELVPLSNIVADEQRVDVRTSVWIMGKLLKVLAFVHSINVALGNVSLGNILIEPRNHYVVIFNWAAARLEPDGVKNAVIRQEVRDAACGVIEVLGGTVETGIPDDGTKEFAVYAAHLLDLATSGGDSAFAANQAFYAMADGLWKRSYHPFTLVSR